MKRTAVNISLGGGPLQPKGILNCCATRGLGMRVVGAGKVAVAIAAVGELDA